MELSVREGINALEWGVGVGRRVQVGVYDLTGKTTAGVLYSAQNRTNQQVEDEMKEFERRTHVS